jgi:REP element-mobilizing transposase RayT
MPHARRSIRLQGYDYAQAGAYFVTICAYERRCLFGNVSDGTMQLNERGRIVEECWEAIPAHLADVELDAFCVMPNHVHGIIIIRRGTPWRAPTVEQFQKPVAGSLPTIVRSFKSAVTKRIREVQHTPGLLVWQRNYYEHVIRHDEDLRRIRVYIENNPVQWDGDDYNR